MPCPRDRDRQAATILLTAELHGPVALLPPLEPGPATCPADCSYCTRKAAA